MVGSVAPEELEAYYRAADVFVCASDHEGFCVPIVEAMAHDLPVVAYGAAAVPETVQDAGLLLESKEPLLFAAAVHRVVEDDQLRRQFSRAAARRVEAFSLPRSRARFVDLVLDGHRVLRPCPPASGGTAGTRCRPPPGGGAGPAGCPRWCRLPPSGPRPRGVRPTQWRSHPQPRRHGPRQFRA